MRDDQKPIALPSIYRAKGLEVRTELLRPDIEDPAAAVVRHVVDIEGGHSTRDVHIALQRAKRELAAVPEELRNVNIVVDRHAKESIQRAQAKRERKAKRASEQAAARAARAEQERAGIEATLRAAGLAPRADR